MIQLPQPGGVVHGVEEPPIRRNMVDSQPTAMGFAKGFFSSPDACKRRTVVPTHSGSQSAFTGGKHRAGNASSLGGRVGQRDVDTDATPERIKDNSKNAAVTAGAYAGAESRGQPMLAATTPGTAPTDRTKAIALRQGVNGLMTDNANATGRAKV